MLHIGICDDNQKDISRVQELAVRFSEQHPEMPIQIQAYSSPYDLLDDIEKTGGFDLYLLDVVMPHMTGVTLARRIRERKERAEILFLTVSKEYAVEAFSVKASGYLIKPVNQSAFEDAVLDCIHRLSPENNPSLLLKSKEGIHRISICELVCVESFNHNQVCTLSDGSMLEASATLSELMEELKNFSVFVRPHRAYIVNMDFIRRLTARELLLTDGKRKHFFCVFLLVLMLIRNSQIDVDIYRKNGELYERFRKRRKRRGELWRLNVTINGIVPVHTIVRVTGNVVPV